MWPVLIRELREESRRPLTYWLRVAAGAALLVNCLLATGGPAQMWAVGGPQLFGAVNSALLATSMLLAPLLAADCISREKREGTLGLLLMTPLTSRSVVVAKATAHSLRAFTVYLTALPFVAIPLLLGGVDYKDLCMATIIHLAVLIIGLASGLAASSLMQDRVGAALTAVGMSVVLAFVFMALHQLFLAQSLPFYSQTWNEDQFLFLVSLFQFNSGLGSAWGGDRATHWSVIWQTLPLSDRFQWFWWLGMLLCLAIALLVLVIFSAASRLQQNAKIDPPPSWVLSIRTTFCEPRYWRALFRRRMTWSLNRNPVGWLQQYCWRSRCAKWLMCLAVIVAESMVLSAHSAIQVQATISVLLVFVGALISCSSFRQERETGAMELLLVTPLSPAQIIFGRVRGCWMQLLPAGFVLLLSSFILAYPFGEFELPWADTRALSGDAIFFLGTAAVIPFVGLYFSMCRIPPTVAFVLTVAFGLVAPAILLRQGVGDGGWAIFGFGQIVIGAVAGWLLHVMLKSRRFALR